MTSDEHCFGRLPCHGGCQVESAAISGNHCKMHRKQVTGGDGSSSDASVFVEDIRLVKYKFRLFVCVCVFIYVFDAAQMVRFSIGRG